MPEPVAPWLLDLLAGRPCEVELDRATLEIARLEYPLLEAAHSLGQLDLYAAEIADRCGDLSDGERFVQTANAWFFGEAGMRGNQDDYYNADNSCLNRVLETGLGIPITLSVVYMEVARRLEKPVFGIGLPGHFLIRYDDGAYSTFIDPFAGGALLVGDRRIPPVDKRAMLVRMLNNLGHAYITARRPAKAAAVRDLLMAADPASAQQMIEHMRLLASSLASRN